MTADEQVVMETRLANGKALADSIQECNEFLESGFKQMNIDLGATWPVTFVDGVADEISGIARWKTLGIFGRPTTREGVGSGPLHTAILQVVRQIRDEMQARYDAI